jgi:hypothetical protein
MVDLGTLGGNNSQATAIDGSMVVGTAELAPDSDGFSVSHVFAYDLADPSPHMIDLDDHVDDRSSSASAVSGRFVAGGRLGGGALDRGLQIGWVSDLADPSPHMVDVDAFAGGSTFGGPHVSHVNGLSASIAVGWAAAPGFLQHAFAEDLADPSPAKLDLGTLGGDNSFAAAVSGSIVVGSADTGDQVMHAFAEDLADPSPAMFDLDPSGGASAATAISGSIVVVSESPGGFAYDLADPSPHMIDLGFSPNGISGSLVIGNANNHAVAFDLAASSPHVIVLASLGGSSSNAFAISPTGLVVGAANNSSNQGRAAIWQAGTATDSSPPSLSLNTPTEGAIYAQGAAVNAEYTCADESGGSGVASCEGSVPTGSPIDTATAGPHTFSVTGTDIVGNTATTSVTYHVVAPVDDTGSVGAGGSFGSGAAPSPNAPLQTNVTSPNGGSWEIRQGATTEPAPSGYGFLGLETDITAPAASATAPLVVHFSIDPTLLASAGLDVTDVEVFRDGVPIGGCTGPSGVASPDPCVFLRATNSDGSAEIDMYTSHASHWNFGQQVTVPPPVAISTTSLPNGSVGASYSTALTATGGAQPIGWSIASGALPAGLTLDASTGVISGIPTSVASSVAFTLRASDTSLPVVQTATASLRIAIGPTADPASAKVGVPYATSIAAFNGVAPYHWSAASGTLPPGVTLNPTTGAISGTPTAEGKFTVAVQVVDSKPRKPEKAITKLTILVAPVAINIAPANLPGATKGVKYSATLTATGGAPSYKFKVTNGLLPSGLGLSGGGAIAGKPTTRNTFTFTVSVTDAFGFTAARSYTVVVS